MHKVKEDSDWDKSVKDLIRDYIPLVVLVSMVIIGIVLAIREL